MRRSPTENYNCWNKRFEDTKGLIRSCNSKKNRQYNVQKKRTKVQIIIFKILHRKLLIEQDEPNKNLGVNLVLFVLHTKLVVQKLLCTSIILTVHQTYLIKQDPHRSKLM